LRIGQLSEEEQQQTPKLCLSCVRQDNSGAEAKLRAPPEHELLMIQSYWDSLSTPQRQQLLIIDIKTLEQWADEVQEKADRQPGKL